ncbi:MAG: cobalamin-independent methionine synthase II family protein [Verrucomicrobiae bacterium]|nr:cobalamin-independent methionine synthase II family protein [Verrucomicrobiae bacterium]
MNHLTVPYEPRILTTTVGSYPAPSWLTANASEEAVVDATRVVFATQRQAGIDLPTDGELYRFDTNYPDANGMIDYFVSRLGGIRRDIGRSDTMAFRMKEEPGVRRKPAGVVIGPVTGGSLNLLEDCERAAQIAGGPFKFTLTSPYMLARTLLDTHHRDLQELTMCIAEVLAAQVRGLPCACVQIDEAHIPGKPEDGPLAAAAINAVLDAVNDGTQRAVHFCFGNYGGQTIQSGTWKRLIGFLCDLHADHLVLELAHRPVEDLETLKNIDPRIHLGLGVVNIKVNQIETSDQIASRIDKAEKLLGDGRVRWVHPDCGFWMLKRSIVDRKIAALAAGRDKYLGIN